jgi:replication factor C small subunit
LVEPNSVPQLILIMADYSYKSAFVADQELNIMAALTEIMSSVNFK